MKIQTILKSLTIVLSTAMLAACGGGGSSSPTASTGTAQNASNASQAIPTTAASNVTQVIEYYGDSTIWGMMTGTESVRVARPAPDVFAGQLPAAARYEVRNEGVSRTTACQLLNGTDGQHLPWVDQMRASAAKFVIINHAINDQRADIGAPVPAYRDCLTNLARQARQRGKIVIFETPNPTDQSGAGLEDYVSAMKAVAAAENVPVIDQYQYLLQRLNGQDVRTLMPDGVHPSDSTYVLKGQFAATEFLKMAF